MAIMATSSDAQRGETLTPQSGADPAQSASASAGADCSPGTVRGEAVPIAIRPTLEPFVRAPQIPMSSTVGTPQWSQEFAARVSWLVDSGEQYASIRLSPEQLGPVEVRLAVREGEARIWFGAALPETRAAIEHALPRLREMLAGTGLALADAGVFYQAPPDPQRGFVWADARRAARDGGPSDVVETLVLPLHRGLIDDYA
jgi:flagellar hook-length control protein FliK